MTTTPDLLASLRDPQLIAFATQRDLDYMQAIEKHGGIRPAARAIGVASASIDKAMSRLKKRAAAQGYAPEHDMTKVAPAGYKVKGVSTYYNEDGKPVGQWVKTSREREAFDEEGFCNLIERLSAPIKGLSPLIAVPPACSEEILAVYPVGDPHFGMKSDHEDTGLGDWDLSIAANTHEAAFDYLTSLAPPAKHALLINCGDALHVNDSSNMTPASGAQLDVDTRFGKMLETAALSFVRCVLRLLQKHEHVTVWCMRGNHDVDSSLALQIALKFYFHHEPRVTVDDGTSYFKYLRFGSVLLGAHHGHGAKAQDLPLLMAADRPEDWGATRHRVWHIGHIHHKQVLKDFAGCTVESHRTLAKQDTWHASRGYRATQDMQMIVYHRDLGEVSRSRCDPAALTLA